MMENAWLIPLFPLISFILLLLVGKKLKESSAYIGIALTLVSFVLSTLVLWDRLSAPTYYQSFTWLTIGDVQLTAGFEVNQLNALMLFVVSLVSLLVHIYSKGYMHGEGRFPVYYSYLGLFTFAMLALVISPNLLQLYIFWELVGVGSFLLIGFYFYHDEAKAAAKKAFIMTRIGDVGLFIGIILLFWQVGSFEYRDIFASLEAGAISYEMITLIAILIFVGAIGKSGQFPLHTWLPDAMEGPTPVSALIHAATMVAAGVYLVATLFPLFNASEAAMMTVAIVGAFTAIFAASIGLVQKDIKRVLAYSTVSQLGFMMLALGAAGYVAGVFHLTTHAFFKALLFLAAGSVIHAAQSQNVEELGGLWSKMRLTGILFLIGTLAISGFPLFSGFFSKEEILIAAWVNGNPFLFIIALIAAFFTAFYMFRLFFMVFTGKSRGDQRHVHESPSVMTIPMIVLAVLAVGAGFINTPWFGHYLGDWLTEGTVLYGPAHISGPAWIMIVATLVSFAGIALAYFMYNKGSIPRDYFSEGAPAAYSMLYNKYWIDELYKGTFVYGSKVIGLFFKYIDEFLVQGTMKGIASFTQTLGKIGSKMQNGQTQTYGAVAFVGLAVLLVIFALVGGYIG